MVGYKSHTYYQKNPNKYINYTGMHIEQGKIITSMSILAKHNAVLYVQ